MRPFFHAALATFGVVISIASANAAPASETSNPASTFDKDRFTKEVSQSPDLPNFHEVHPFLYRSGGPTQAGFATLKEHNIKTVIDLRAPTEKGAKDEPEWAKQNGIKYIRLVMSSKAPTKEQVDTFLNETKAAQKDPSKGAVLVHCAHGSDRTGCMVGIWRVTEDGYTYPEAYKEMRRYWFTPKFTNLSGTVEKYAEHTGAKKTATR